MADKGYCLGPAARSYRARFLVYPPEIANCPEAMPLDSWLALTHLAGLSDQSKV